MFKLYTNIYTYNIYLYVIHTHTLIYIYTQYIYIYTHIVLYIYIWPFIQGPWILFNTSSLTKLCEVGSFILQTVDLMPILNSLLCCFLLTSHISVRGVFGNGNNDTS